MTKPAESLTVLADGVPMSGLISRVSEPRGVLVALHGGASGAAYFDGTAHPDQSLLRLGSSLGYTVLAVDRPGYGASAGRVAGWTVAAKVALLQTAITAMLAAGSTGAGVVLVGHSIGCQLSTQLAARVAGPAVFGPAVAGPAVIGLALSGTATTYRSDFAEPPGTEPVDADPRARSRRVWQRIWASETLYPAGARTANRLACPVPRPPAEGPADPIAWLAELPALAKLVRVPVQVAMAEHDGLWDSEWADLVALGDRFEAAPWVQPVRMMGTPHNISISWGARAYHLGIVAFAEQCIRAAAGSPERA